MRLQKSLLLTAGMSLLCFLFLILSVPAADKKAPPFTLKDISGNTVSLSDFENRVVVLDFWATWCHACEESSPELNNIYGQYKDRGLVVIGISLDKGEDALEKVKYFRDRLKLTYIMLMGNDKLARAYMVKGIPTSYVLDKNHVITARYDGALFNLGDLISSQVEQLL